MSDVTTAIDNRGGPAHRHADGGNLWYIHPATQERFISVTTVLDFIDSPGLSLYWRPGLAAKTAFEELPRLFHATLTQPCGRAYRKCQPQHDFRTTCPQCPCGSCEECLTKELAHKHFAESRRRADEGSDFHTWIKHWVQFDGEEIGAKPEIKPYVDSFRQFVADFGLTPPCWELSEATVLNRAHGWGGTLDAQVRFDASASPQAWDLCDKFGLATPLVTVDYKSREGEGAMFWPSNAKQLSAYRRGETVLDDLGNETPLAPTDGGVVFQFRPDGYAWRPVVTDDTTYQAFLANVASALWEIEYGPKSTQVKSFPSLGVPDIKRPDGKGTGPAPQTKKKAAKATPRVGAARAAAAVATHPAPEGARLTDDMIPF